MPTAVSPRFAKKVKDFVREEFHPRFGQLEEQFETDGHWTPLRRLGTELWLDTGSLEDSKPLWCREFSAMTTNNTLLNREVQRGTYDELIPRAADLTAMEGLTHRRKLLELAFILNARHGLKLVEAYDAYVCVEEHTDLAHDLGRAVEYGIRLHEICPERFIVKVPLTPAGVLASRLLIRQGIPVNHTLGFGARQNYVAARIAQPSFVNVFLGRLNSFVADNGLGDGSLVGERATLASQAAIRRLRDERGIDTRQIGASFRDGRQVRSLAGIDVMTMPPKVARQFKELHLPAEQLPDRTREDYQPPINDGVDPEAVRLDTLWDIDAEIVEACDALEREDLDEFSPDDLVSFFHDRGVKDLFVRWSDEQIRTSADEGKIPKLDRWRDALTSGRIGLDALMNLAGLNSFTADQKDMDDRVADQMQKAGTYRPER